MDAETIVRVVAALGVMYTIARGTVELMSGRTSKMRDEYRFANEFLTFLATAKEIHPYALEKG